MKTRIAVFGGTPLVLTPDGFGMLVADETVKWEKVGWRLSEGCVVARG